jgi:hypothetical protein
VRAVTRPLLLWLLLNCGGLDVPGGSGEENSSATVKSLPVNARGRSALCGCAKAGGNKRPLSHLKLISWDFTSLTSPSTDFPTSRLQCPLSIPDTFETLGSRPPNSVALLTAHFSNFYIRSLSDYMRHRRLAEIVAWPTCTETVHPIFVREETAFPRSKPHFDSRMKIGIRRCFKTAAITAAEEGAKCG